MTINMGIALALIMSIVLNLLAFWYIRVLLGRLLWISQNLNDLVQIIKAYSENLTSVYRLEQFYGDAEIKQLILHTNSLIDILRDYEDVTLITEQIEIEEDGLELQQEEPQNAEEEIQEKHVLYAGTRERNN